MSQYVACPSCGQVSYDTVAEFCAQCEYSGEMGDELDPSRELDFTTKPTGFRDLRPDVMDEDEDYMEEMDDYLEELYRNED